LACHMQENDNVVNQEIARVFERMAKVLAFKGENRFRVLAYERAAESLRDLKRDLREMAPETFEEIPAIGEDLAAMIAEYLKKGRIARYERERRGIPDELVDLMSIPGLGPKTLGILHQTLKVQSLGDLKRVLGGQAILKLPGFGEKKAANLRKAVEVWTGGRERMALGVAMPIAEELLGSIRKNPFIEKADIAGSLRRGKDTIGDLDLLILSKHSRRALTEIAHLPQVKRVTALGDTRLSMIIEGGAQVDVRAVPEESYGAALQYFTGSKDHNIHLRTIARQRGLKINEYGVFRGERQIGGRHEEDVYRALGLPVMPPEIREDHGEIEAASRAKLPALISLKDLRGDLHVHTSYSDGRASLEEMVSRAEELGYDYVALTDHSLSARIANGLDEKRLEQKLEEIQRLRAKRRGKKPEILIGAEVDILSNGRLDYTDLILERLDVVVVAIHSAFAQPSDRMTERILDALDHPRVNVLAHPTARLLGSRAPITFDFARIVARAIERRIALEINGSYLRIDLNDAMAREAAAAGCLFSIASDAHTPSSLNDVRYGVLQGRRAWLGSSNVVNTWTYQKLRRWLSGS
jgi:DNA polymerase (family X)